MSPNVQDITGYGDRDFISGKIKYADIIHPEDREDVVQGVETALAENQGNSKTKDYRIISKDGNVKWISEYISLSKHNESNLDQPFGYIIDITARNAEEERVKEEKERWQSAIEGSRSGVWDWNALTDKVFYSKRWKEMLGYSEDEIGNELSEWEKRIHPDDKDQVFADLNKHLSGKKTFYENTHRMLTKSGTYKWVMDRGTVIDWARDGSPLRVIGTHTDITDYKNMEQERLEAAKMNKLLIEYAPYGVVVYNSHGDAVTVNQAAVDAIGAKDKKALLSQNFYNIPSWQKYGLVDTADSALKSEEVIHQRLHIPETSFGKQIWLEISFVPIHITGKLHLMIIFRDITQEKITEIELRNSQEIFHQLTESIDEVFWLRTDNKMLYVSPAFERLWEQPRGELYKNPDMFLETIHPEDKERVVSAFGSDQYRVKGQFDEEYRIVRPDATVRWIRARTFPIRDAEGNIYRKAGVAEDISDYKAMSNKLKESEERYRGVVESQQEMIVRVNQNGQFTFVNGAYCRMFGKTKEDLLGTSFQPLIHEDDIEQTMKEMKKLESPPYRVYLEQRAKTAFGWRWISWEDYAIRNEYGQIIEVQGIGRDITERKETEKKLEKNLQQQELLSDISIELNKLEDFDDKMDQVLEKLGMHTNVSRVYIFEDSQDTEETTNVYEWTNKGVFPQKENLQNIPYAIIPSWNRLLETRGYIFSDNIKMLPKDIYGILADQGILSILAFPLKVQGRKIGFIGFDENAIKRNWDKTDVELLRIVSNIISNAYERMYFDNQLKNAYEAAHKANKAKSVFLANMSHEIRTPMNSILGFAEILHNQLETDIEQHGYIENIITSGNILLSLINDILDLSKIESGKVTIERDPVDISLLVNEVAAVFQIKAEKKGIHLKTDINSSMTQVITDEVKMRQILFNLVGNAVKFTDSGGVTIRVDTDVSAEDAQKQNIKITVTDTGIGIPPDQKESIFEPFHQQQGQSSRKYGGTGLGLSISLRLVQLLGGKLNIESTVGVGTDFTVSLDNLDICTQGKQIGERKKATEVICFKPGKVLIVEDVETNRELIKVFLSETELVVLEAENGEEGVNVALEQKPDLILMDIRMPIMDGYAAARLLRDNPETENIPVIALTASLMKEEVERIRENFSGYLRKPLKRDGLLNHLAGYLETYSSENKSIDQEDQSISHMLQWLTRELQEKQSPKDITSELFTEVRPLLTDLQNGIHQEGTFLLAKKLDELSDTYSLKSLKRMSGKITDLSAAFDIITLDSAIQTLWKYFSGM